MLQWPSTLFVWFCVWGGITPGIGSGVSPGYHSEIYSWRCSYGMSWTEPWLATYKALALPTVISLWPDGIKVYDNDVQSYCTLIPPKKE